MIDKFVISKQRRLEKKEKKRKLLVVAGNRFDKSGPVISRGKTRRDAGRNGEGGGRKKYTVTGPYQGLNCTVSRIRRGITVSHERRGTKSGRQDSLEESVPRRTLSPPPSTSAKCTHRGGLDCRCIMHSNLWSESSRAWSSLFPATLLLLSSSFIFPPSPLLVLSPILLHLPSSCPLSTPIRSKCWQFLSSYLSLSFFVSSSQIDDSILARKYFILKHDSIQRWSSINKLSFHQVKGSNRKFLNFFVILSIMYIITGYRYSDDGIEYFFKEIKSIYVFLLLYKIRRDDLINKKVIESVFFFFLG